MWIDVRDRLPKPSDREYWTAEGNGAIDGTFQYDVVDSEGKRTLNQNVLRWWWDGEGKPTVGPLETPDQTTACRQQIADLRAQLDMLQANLRVAQQWWASNQDSPKSALAHFMEIPIDAVCKVEPKPKPEPTMMAPRKIDIHDDEPDYYIQQVEDISAKRDAAMADSKRLREALRQLDREITDLGYTDDITIETQELVDDALKGTDHALVAEDDNERLRALLRWLFCIADQAPELNLSNYNIDQIRCLNDKMVELYLILKDALKGAADAGKK